MALLAKMVTITRIVYLCGSHPISYSVCKQLFQKSVDFHSLPYKEKIKIELNELHRGYIPINTSTDRNSKLAVVTKPNQSESFIMMREAGMNDPAVKSGDYLAGPNQWPEGLPGFQEILTSYFDELTHLCHKICRVIALVLGADLKTFASELNNLNKYTFNLSFCKLFQKFIFKSTFRIQ